MMLPYRTRIVALRTGAVVDVDEHGNPVYGPDQGTAYYGEFRPLETSEHTRTDGTDVPVTRFKVFLPPQVTNLTGYDRMLVGGVQYTLQGHPEPHNIGGRLHHWECLVKRSG